MEPSNVVKSALKKPRDALIPKEPPAQGAQGFKRRSSIPMITPVVPAVNNTPTNENAELRRSWSAPPPSILDNLDLDPISHLVSKSDDSEVVAKKPWLVDNASPVEVTPAQSTPISPIVDNV